MTKLPDSERKLGDMGWLEAIMGLHGRSYGADMYTLHVYDQTSNTLLFDVTLPATIRGQRVVVCEDYAKMSISGGPIMPDEITEQAPAYPTIEFTSEERAHMAAVIAAERKASKKP